MGNPESRKQKHTLFNVRHLFANRLSLPLPRRLNQVVRRRFYNRDTALALGLIAGLGLSMGAAQAFDARLARPLRRYNRTPINRTITTTTPPASSNHQPASLKTTLETTSRQTSAVATVNGHKITLTSPQVISRHYQTPTGSTDVTIKFDKSTSQANSGSQTSQSSLEVRSSSSASADTSVRTNKTRGSP